MTRRRERLPSWLPWLTHWPATQERPPVVLGENIYPQALRGVRGGRATETLPCAPGFTQPGFLPTHSQWDLGRCCPAQGATGPEGALCWKFRGLLLNSRPGPVPGLPSPPGVICGPGGRGQDVRLVQRIQPSLGEGLGKGLGVKAKLGEGGVSGAESWEGCTGTGRGPGVRVPLKAPLPVQCP